VRGGGFEYDPEGPRTTGVILLLSALGRKTAINVCGVVEVVGAYVLRMFCVPVKVTTGLPASVFTVKVGVPAMVAAWF